MILGNYTTGGFNNESFNIGKQRSGNFLCGYFEKNSKDIVLTVIGKETIMPYYRPQLSHMLCNGKVDKKFF